MNAYELLDQAEKHAAKAAEITPSNTDNQAILHALLALTHATMAVATRTSSNSHCENCCEY